MNTFNLFRIGWRRAFSVHTHLVFINRKTTRKELRLTPSKNISKINKCKWNDWAPYIPHLKEGVLRREEINGGWETVLNYLNLDLDVDPEQHERLVVEPSEEDVAKLESRRQTAHFKIYVPLDYDPNDGDKGLYVRWDMPVGAARRDMYFQAYHDWALTDYWTVTGGFPESGPRHFERWS